MKNHFYKSLVLIPVLLILNLSFLIQNCSAQWVQVSNGMGIHTSVVSFAVNGNNIFAGTEYGAPGTGGVYISTNNGISWAKIGLDSITVHCFFITGNKIFAGTYQNGVYLSTNSGTNWIQTSLNNEWIYSIVMLGTNIFAGTYHGVYKSTDNGMSWIQTSLNYRYAPALATLGNNIFAGTGGYGVYLSTNNGTTWTQTALNYQQNIVSLATSGNIIFAGVFNNFDTDYVYRSTNNGVSWTHTGLNKSVQSLIINGNYIFAGAMTEHLMGIIGGVYLSKDNGISWLNKNQGFSTVPSVYEFIITNNFIFAGTDISIWRRSYAEIIGIKQISEVVPSSYSLQQNYPNPFNPITTIGFDVSKTENVILKVFDITGKEISTLINEKLNPGTYETQWNANEYSSGVYFYRLETKDYRETKRMVLIK